MPGENVLLTIAQVAVAFAGFSSVVVVFGQRAVGRWTEEDLVRFAFLITSSLVVVFLAFLPIFLRLLHCSDTVAWGISSTVLGVAALILTAVAWRRVLRVKSRHPGFVGATAVNSLFRGAAFILQILNLIGPFDHEAGPYVVGTGLLMLTAAAPFGALLYSGIERDV